MTSVVLAMNEKGLAAAADSAAVAGGKIFTADKVFQPIEGEPLCLIVYGRADVCTVPIEAVVGGYRKSRAGVSFPTVRAFAEDFMSFAEGRGDREAQEPVRRRLAEVVPEGVHQAVQGSSVQGEGHDGKGLPGELPEVRIQRIGPQSYGLRPPLAGKRVPQSRHR